MAVTLNAREIAGFVALAFPDESGDMVGSQAVVCIPQYNMIFKYYLKGYSKQAALTDKHQTLMGASVEAVDGDVVLKFEKFLVEEWEMTLFTMIHRTSSMHFLTLLARGVAQSGPKLLLILSRLEAPKFLIPIKASSYLVASWQAWHASVGALGCWCCFVAVFSPLWSHLVQDP